MAGKGPSLVKDRATLETILKEIREIVKKAKDADNYAAEGERGDYIAEIQEREEIKELEGIIGRLEKIATEVITLIEYIKEMQAKLLEGHSIGVIGHGDALGELAGKIKTLEEEVQKHAAEIEAVEAHIEKLRKLNKKIIFEDKVTYRIEWDMKTLLDHMKKLTKTVKTSLDAEGKGLNKLLK